MLDSLRNMPPLYVKLPRIRKVGCHFSLHKVLFSAHLSVTDIQVNNGYSPPSIFRWKKESQVPTHEEVPQRNTKLQLYSSLPILILRLLPARGFVVFTRRTTHIIIVFFIIVATFSTSSLILIIFVILIYCLSFAAICGRADS